jgi:hypothetical protein
MSELVDEAANSGGDQGTSRVYHRDAVGKFASKPITSSKSNVPDTRADSTLSDLRSPTKSVIVRSTGPGIVRVGPPITKGIPVVGR